MNPSLKTFLEAKPLYYKVIDHTRIHQAYGLLKPHIKHPKTVHIVGTNGKGSTGRALAHIAFESGLAVGHYSSPHIMRFNERIWLGGEECSDEVLELAHQKLYAILAQTTSEALSYFEYTTLLALVVFEHLDLIVLEAGLGGEYDATNVCDKVLSIITPIGLDHQAFLGETIEEIAQTKLRSMQTKVLLAPQVFEVVRDIAKETAEQRGVILYETTPPSEALREMGRQKGWSDFLLSNIAVAVSALEILQLPYRLEALHSLELFGRFYKIAPNVRIDVGHNPLAAQAIEKALEYKVVLIYNSLDDKDYTQVLKNLKPKIKRVEIIPIDSQRATTLSEIEKALQSVGLEYRYFDEKIEEDEEYLVFGSFFVVEAFLKRFNVSK